MKIIPILFVLINTIFPQITFQFDHLDISDGLSQNDVTGITQDTTGFIWFATKFGLNRYDDYNIKVYKSAPGKENSISDNFINEIFTDSFGKIWIGTNSGGLNCLDASSGKIQVFDQNTTGIKLAQNITAVTEDNYQNLWVGTFSSGLFKIDPERKSSYKYIIHGDVKSGSVTDNISILFVDSKNRIWIGSRGNGLVCFDEKTGGVKSFQSQNSSLSNNFITAIAEDKSGNIWIGTSNGLNKLEKDERNFIKYFSYRYNRNSIPSDIINTLLVDSNGELLIGTSGGLAVLKSGKINRVSENYLDPATISSSNIMSLFEDSAGIIWIGTKSGGVNKYNRFNSNFTSIVRTTAENSLSSNNIRSVITDKFGNVWIGTYATGLNFYNTKENNYYQFGLTGKESPLYNLKITAIVIDSNYDFWIGTDSRGLFKASFGLNQGKGFPKLLSLKNYRHNSQDSTSLTFDYIKNIYLDSNDNLWIGTEYGLNFYNPGSDSFRRFITNPDRNNSLSDNRIQSRCILLDDQGYLWVGTWNGLNRMKFFNRNDIYNSGFENKRFFYDETDSTSVTDNRIISLIEDNNKTIWVGTYSGGINKIINNPVSGKIEFEYYLTEKDRPNSIIYSIEKDNKNMLWLGTSDGLYRFNIEKKVFRLFDISDGLQSNKYNWGASYYSNNGKMYFGGFRGINVFNPDSVINDTFIPPVVITKFQVLDKEIFNDSELNKLKTVKLNYSDNSFSIEFSSLDYSAPLKNEYAYYLEGFEDNWIYSGKRRYVSYSNLEGGNYYFRVKATNNDGVWNETGTELKIVVVPPFWHTWSFRITVFLLLSLTVIFLVRLKLNAGTKKNIQLRTDIENQKQIEAYLKDAKAKADESGRLKFEFLAQMSHEIRTPINSILSYASLLKEELVNELPGDLKDGFDIIDNSGQRLIKTIDFILNVSQMQTGTYESKFTEFSLQEIISQIITELKQKSKDKGIELSFQDYSENYLVVADRYTVSQMMLNLIDNAIKYTEKGSVNILMKAEDDKIIVEIKDTGVGMSEEFLPKLFDAFSQEESGYLKKGEANGLGLALVKRYSEVNDIKINVSSKKNKGTVFTLIFKKTEKVNA